MITFDEARRIVEDEWDYEIAEHGYETPRYWLLLPLPLTAGGRIPAVSKDNGEITWINENSEIYTQEFPVGKRPRSDGGER